MITMTKEEEEPSPVVHKERVMLIKKKKDPLIEREKMRINMQYLKK